MLKLILPICDFVEHLKVKSDVLGSKGVKGKQVTVTV